MDDFSNMMFFADKRCRKNWAAIVRIVHLKITNRASNWIRLPLGQPRNHVKMEVILILS